MDFEDSIDTSEVVSTSASNPPLSYLNDLDISNDVKRRLSSYLNSLIPGSNDIYITPIGESSGPEALLLEWDAIFNSKVSRMNKTLLELESSNRSKYGPRSIMKPWSERQKDVLEYFDSDRSYTFIPPKVTVPSINLRPLSISRAVSYLKNSTNSGLPYYMKKKSVKHKLINMSENELKSKLDIRYPCILFTRTQEGGKTRDVWGYPIYDTLQETRYYVPLLSYQSKLSWRSALRGPDYVDRSITELIYKCMNDPEYIMVSIDFSAFDRSVLTGISSEAFNYISKLFQKSETESIDHLRDRFQTIGIVTPSGIYSGAHGVPSGSTFTNEVDSLVQFLVALSSGVIIDTMIQIQGDDGVYLIKREFYERLINTFLKAGLTVNTLKSYSSDQYCIYLQNLYHRDYIGENGIVGGIYSTYRALCRIVYQERFVDFMDVGLDGKDYYSLRTIAILEGCKFHPLFEDFVKFILSKDKYLLAFSKDSLNKYSDLVAKGPGSGGVINNRYGDVISGIYSFKTMSIINSLV